MLETSGPEFEKEVKLEAARGAMEFCEAAAVPAEIYGLMTAIYAEIFIKGVRFALWRLLREMKP